MTLGDVIKNYREEHNLSMDSFSKISGISKAYISLLEKNRHPKTGKTIAPSLEIIKQAASGMGMDFDSLFNMIDDEVDISRPILSPNVMTNESLHKKSDSDDQQLTTKETELIDKYRNLDEYGKDVVETVASKEYDRCMADRENEIVLTPEQIRALPLQERLEAIKHDADFALVARRK